MRAMANDKLYKAINKKIGEAARKTSNAVLKGSIRALNSATKAGRKETEKILRAETGLDKKIISKRLRSPKASEKNMKAIVSVATKVGVPLDNLKAKSVKVRVVPSNVLKKRGRPKARTYTGLSVKIGRTPRQVIPGAYLQQIGSKILSLGRKSQFDGSGKYTKAKPTSRTQVRLRAPVVRDVTRDKARDIQRVMRKTYGEKLGAEIAKIKAKS